MPRTFFGPYSAAAETHAEPAGGNTGRFGLGDYLVTPDGRKYRYALNDGTVEVAGNLYQSALSVTGHRAQAVDVARAIGAVVISSTIATTAAGEDIYNEGVVHPNITPGIGYAYRIRRARSAAQGHASAASATILTVNLEPDSSVQVALTTGTSVTYSRNRFHAVSIHPSPPTARLAGVSPGVAAADRYYWSQVGGEAAVLADGTLLEGLPVQASITVNGAVESYKRRVTSSGSSTASTPSFGVQDSGGATTSFVAGLASGSFDITGGISVNAPLVGLCIQPNADAAYALIDLLYLGAD